MAENEEKIPEILKSPALLHYIKKDLDNFVIGEDENKLLLFLVCASSHGYQPLGAVIAGSSSSGKSYLMNQITKAFKSNTIEFTRMTSASLDRLQTDMKGKILKVEEMRGIEDVQSKLRVLISEGGLRLLSTRRNEEGNIDTEVIETKGTPVFLTTTANYQIDEELTNRLFIISIDESPEQTRKILKFQRKFWNGSESLEAEKFDLPWLDHLFAFRVVIPYYDLLADTFPVDSVKARRDFQKLCHVIEVVAFLHQYQRVRICKTDCKIPQYIVAYPSDFYMAWTICNQTLRQTLMNVQKRALDVLDLFKPNEFKTVRTIADDLQMSQSWARECLKALVRSGFLTVDEKYRTHQYWLSEKAKAKATLWQNEVSLESFGEKELKTWLDQCFFNTVGENPNHNPTLYHSYVHPITGKIHGSLSPSVLQNSHSEAISIPKPPEKPLKTSFSETVPISTDFTPEIQKFYESGTYEDINHFIEKRAVREQSDNQPSRLAEVGLALKKIVD